MKRGDHESRQAERCTAGQQRGPWYCGLQLVREASWRVLSLRPFDVQLIGGIILHEGEIAEMRTGEGKTLVSVMPAYLNALSGKGARPLLCHLPARPPAWPVLRSRFEFSGSPARPGGDSSEADQCCY